MTPDDRAEVLAERRANRITLAAALVVVVLLLVGLTFAGETELIDGTTTTEVAP